jgi:hypothetical protein
VYAGAAEQLRVLSAPVGHDRGGLTVASFTSLGAENLFIAKACATAGQVRP